MGTLRRLLFNDNCRRRATLLLLALFFCRALVSNALMLDPGAPSGSFGLAICSGHGPLSFASFSASGRADAASIGMARISLHHHADDAGSNSGDQQTSPDSICPFSATLFAAIFALAIGFVLFFLRPFSIAPWPRRSREPCHRQAGNRPPEARAPPAAH